MWAIELRRDKERSGEVLPLQTAPTRLSFHLPLLFVSPPSASLIPQPPPSLCLFSWLDVFTSEKSGGQKKRCRVLFLNAFVIVFFLSLRCIFCIRAIRFCSQFLQVDPHRDESFVFLFGKKGLTAQKRGEETDILGTKTLVCGTWGQAGIPRGIHCIKG